MKPAEAESVTRLDSWLWAVRFYKTRPLAVAAIKNGRILVNGARAKPARALAIGDTLLIHKEDALEMEVSVLGLISKRVSAKIAQTLYHESAESVRKREIWQQERKMARELVRFPEQRPDKRERRQLRAIRHQDEF